MIIVLKDSNLSNVYRSMLKSGLITPETLKDRVAVYYYSSELGTFNFRNSIMKHRHNIKEHVIVMSMEQIAGFWLTRVMLGLDMLDLDVIMVN